MFKLLNGDTEYMNVKEKKDEKLRWGPESCAGVEVY